MRQVWREDLRGSLGKDGQDAYDQEIDKVVAELVELRKALQKTQEEIASKLGTTRFYLSRIEQGAARPSIALLSAIANLLDRKLSVKISLKHYE